MLRITDLSNYCIRVRLKIIALFILKLANGEGLTSMAKLTVSEIILFNSSQTQQCTKIIFLLSIFE